MDVGRCDVKELRYVSLKIEQSVDLDTGFGSPELSPFIDTQTEVDGGRIEGVDLTSQFEYICIQFLLGLCDHEVGIVFKDSVIS